MNPKKAILILFILFLMAAGGFIFLYIQKNQTVKKTANQNQTPVSEEINSLNSNQDPVKQAAELKALDDLRNQYNAVNNNQTSNPAEDLKALDKLRQAASSTAPNAKDTQTELQNLDRLRAEYEASVPK